MPTHLVGGHSNHHQSYHQIPPASTEPECLRSLIVFRRIIVAAQDHESRAISDRLKVVGQRGLSVRPCALASVSTSTRTSSGLRSAMAQPLNRTLCECGFLHWMILHVNRPFRRTWTITTVEIFKP
jgi:hypothetical protein